MIGKTKTFAGGKVIVTDFKRLNPDMFKPLYDLSKGQLKKQSFLCTPDGKLYLNKAANGVEMVAHIFELLVRESKNTLLDFQQEYQKLFPDIKDFDDWNTMQGTNEDKVKAYAMLCVPAELKRREIELEYSGKISLFHG